MQNKKTIISSHQNTKTQNRSKNNFWCRLVSLCFGGKITFKLITLTLLTSLTFSCSIFKKAQDDKVDYRPQALNQDTVNNNILHLSEIDTQKIYIDDSFETDKVMNYLPNNIEKVKSYQLQGMLYKDIVIDSIPYIVKKVFPNVTFYRCIAFTPPENHISIGMTNKEKSYGHNTLNYLYKKMEHEEKIFIHEKIKAYLYLFEGFKKNITISSIRKVNKKMGILPFSFYYEVHTSIGKEQRIFYLHIKNEQILYIGELKNNELNNIGSPSEAP